jgi:hypothetical protein
MTDPAYEYRLQEALAAVRREIAQGRSLALACDDAARAWRVSFRDLEAAYRQTEEK